jgi:putative spermidine/putrescine transport system ATP-binding protein
VRLAGVSKAYGGVPALRDLSLEAAPGDLLAVVGPSGAGKSTLLMVLAGFVPPDAGTVTFDGVSVATTPPHRREIGLVFQDHALFPHLDVFGNVAFPLRLRGRARADTAARVRDALSLVSLPGLEGRRIDQLSAGQRQRVALARALVFEPRLLLLDEPLAALDRPLRDELGPEIRTLQQRLGVTTFYVTHDQREALALGDRVAVLRGGVLQQVGRPADLYEQPQSRFVAEFLGETRCLPVERGADGPCVQGRPLRLLAAAPPGPLVLAVRADRVRVLARGTPGDGVNRFEGTVTSALYQGDSMLLRVTVGAGIEVAVRLATDRAGSGGWAAGMPVSLGLAPEDTLLLPAGTA